MNTDITTLQRRIAKLEAQKTMLEKALALQTIRQNEYAHNARISIIPEELDIVKSITVRVERNLVNNPILVIDFECDDLI